MANELTPKQEKFIQNIVAGMSQRQAYKDAFQVDYDDNAIDVNACKVFNDAKVQLRYKELMEKLEDKAIMTAKERMIWLTGVLTGDIKETYTWDGEERETTPNMANKLKAMDILNKMSGEYITKIEGDIGVTTVRVDIEDE